VFDYPELTNHINQSSSVSVQSLILAEWNMNVPENIKEIGNYRYRPLSISGDYDYVYHTLPDSFTLETEDTVTKYYYGATDSDISVDGGFNNDNTTPVAFSTKQQKEKMLYSLEDCFGKFRPRSGINKMRYFSGRFFNFSNPDMSLRPRYYMADKTDKFKYWTSYRNEVVSTSNNIEKTYERGVASKIVGSNFYIDDAAPFVVYETPVPTNKIVIKVQTNVGTLELGDNGNFINIDKEFSDPFSGNINKTTPVNWKLQVLKENSLDHTYKWKDIASFNADSIRPDGGLIFKEDGYLELQYTYDSNSIDSSWTISNESVNNSTSMLTNLIADSTKVKRNLNTGQEFYDKFEYIKGLRIVVDTMNVFESTFDLIELSPRLVADISDKTKDFSIKKIASDIGVSGLPVGQLLASTGTLNIFDYDQSFFPENSSSIISKYTTQNVQFKFYEKFLNVVGSDYYVPIKTMYSEGFPDISNKDRSVSLKLRDLFLHFESFTAPQLFLSNVSLSTAISILLDNIGFSNYLFKRNTPNEKELIITDFYVSPDKTVAEVLSDLAISSQSAMFFDEYNNLIVMSKDYIMPDNSRTTSTIIRGTKDFNRSGAIKNNNLNTNLANIIEISSTQNSVFNDGAITYKTAYIQKSYASIKQATLLNKDKTWIYKPALLWEVSPENNIRSSNEEVTSGSAYGLTAIPLNSNLSAAIPEVQNGNIINNIISFGDGVYSLGRHSGYFYSNGEIIKYDAIEYSVSGYNDGTGNSTVWISSNQEYQKYFANLPFNGKIYPTGNVRIYAEPKYTVSNGSTVLKPGKVTQHGRGQFGTEITTHSAGLYTRSASGEDGHPWLSDNYVRGCNMDFTKLSNPPTTPISVIVGEAGKTFSTDSNAITANDFAKKTTRSDSIKNFLSSPYLEESTIDHNLSTNSSTIQSSALVMNGADTSSLENTPGFISYTYKPLNDKFVHFGTRMRIVGRTENNEGWGQTPVGVKNYYSTTTVTNGTTQQKVIGGASGGIGVFVNPETNNGYFFEIMALTQNNISSLDTGSNIDDIIFYKTVKRTLTDNNITFKRLDNGVATLTTSTPHGYAIGDNVTVSNVDSTFDGTYTVSNARTSLTSSITSVSGTGTTATYSSINNFAKGDIVTITGLTNSGFNVSNITIDSATTTTFTIKNTTSATINNQNGVATTANTFSYKISFASKISSLTGDGTNVTYYTDTNHNIKVGQLVTITGFSPLEYNVSNQIVLSTPTPTSFSVANTKNSQTYPYSGSGVISNVSLLNSAASGSVTVENIKAIPVKLWGGVGSILVDDGNFTGQSRLSTEDKPTVYDLAVEYKKTGSSITFYLYINNVQIATVVDSNPLPICNNVALFIRGSSKVMFENVYALSQNYSQNTTFSLGTVSESAFGDLEINASTSFQKYALNGLIKSTYLSGIGTSEPPKYKIYYDEFGTIMREAAYFNVRYDKAYPALYARLVPTINKVKGYIVSGFRAWAYGAEFLIFNATDTILSLDSTSGNYLKINGITFTQQSQNELKVDDYFARVSDFSNPQRDSTGEIISPELSKKNYVAIKQSRSTYGKKQFNLNTPYVQSQDEANSLMEWLISKIMKPRKSVGVKIFANPMIQLGDIVEVEYTNENGIDEISANGSRYTVYSIEYNRSSNGPEMVIYLSEIV
jgi:hypothetical protein